MQAVNSPRQSHAEGERALHPARRLLDEYAGGQITAAELGSRLTALCDGNTDAGWEALSWLDQYHRRGVLETSRFRDIKLRIERLAVPGHATTEIRASAPPPVALANGDAAEPGDRPDSVLLVDESEPALEAAAAEALVAPGDGQPGAVPRRLGVGTLLRGRYEILNELGRGGMGTVYRARDRHRLGLEHVSDCVALKVLREDWVARPEALAALRHECFRAQALSHPNIVNVFDFDRDEHVCFVSMELVDGQPLSQVLERIRPRRLARADALALLEAVGAALHYAHSCGVVHADLKPGNVMVGHDGKVRVLDFGLARPVVREPSVDGAEAARTLRAATPAYASPDVLKGGNPGVRDDVFSFGCLAYELLGGEPAFPRQSVDEARRGRATPRRPRGVRRDEWRLIRKALAPERERRLASVEKLLDGLRPEKLTPVPPLKALSDRATTGGTGWLRTGLRVVTACVFIAAAVLLVRAFTAAPRPRASVETAAPPAVADPTAVERVTPIQVAPATRLAPVAAPPSAKPAQASNAEPPPATAAPASNLEPPPPTPAVSPAPKSADVPLKVPTAAQVQKPVPAPATGPARISLSADRYTVSESGSIARVKLTRTGSLRDAVAVRWWTEPGEATADEDYADLGPEIEHFAAGQASAVIFVPIVSDAVHEGIETFSVYIRSDSTGVEIGRDRATIIIVDDD
jgi:Protein kinase domain/Calx-beta domain